MVRALLFLVVASGCVAGMAGTRDPDGGLIDWDSGRGRDAGMRDAGMADAGRDVDARVVVRETNCSDGIDQDDDGRFDCEDLECDRMACDDMGRVCLDLSCGGCRMEPSETMCGDGADEDCDGMADCLDSDCDGVECGPDVVCAMMACPCPSGFVERMCGDSRDDDCDSLSDCADPDCLGLVCGANEMVCLSDGTCACTGSGVEICNGVDDDCTRGADNECPLSLTTCCEAVGSSFGVETGTVFADPCPPNTMLIGISGRESAARIDQIQPICAALRVESDEMGPEFSYSVSRTADIVGGLHGGGGGTMFTDRCPGNEIAIGVIGGGDTMGVQHVALQCGAVTIAEVAGDWRATITPTGRTPDRGGTPGTMGGTCTSGFVVTQLNGRADTIVRSLGSTCERLELQTIP